MPTFYLTSTIPASPDAAFTWHTRPGALERQLPPWSGIAVERQPPGGVQDGSHVILRMPVGPLRLPWVGVYYGIVPGRQYCDEQLEGPFNSWHHIHRTLPVPNGSGCILEDDVRYAVSWLVRLMARGEGRIRQQMQDVFAFRHARAQADIVRHQRFAQHGALRIAVTGANGLLGRRLVPFLRSGGHTVLRLVRSGKDKARDAVRWDPDSGALDIERLGNVDAVIHMAGESIGAGRWSAKRKAAIRSSRGEATRELCATLAHLAQPPKVFIGASAVGYYGDRPQGAVTEADGPGKGFLPQVCQSWEAAAEPLHSTGTRIVHLRMGMVVAGEGGAVPRMVRLFRLGLGGRLGSGRQAMPWIAAEDAIGIAHQALFDDRMAGPINAVAPQSTSNRDFTRVLAKALNRLAILPVPGAALRLAMGEMAQSLLLEGATVTPARLQALGFPFLFSDLETAIRFELGKDKSTS